MNLKCKSYALKVQKSLLFTLNYIFPQESASCIPIELSRDADRSPQVMAAAEKNKSECVLAFFFFLMRKKKKKEEYKPL